MIYMPPEKKKGYTFFDPRAGDSQRAPGPVSFDTLKQLHDFLIEREQRLHPVTELAAEKELLDALNKFESKQRRKAESTKTKSRHVRRKPSQEARGSESMNPRLMKAWREYCSSRKRPRDKDE